MMERGDRGEIGVYRERKERQGTLVMREIMDLLVSLVILEHQDPREVQELRVPRDILDRRVILGRICVVGEVCRDSVDDAVLRAQWE